MPPTNQDDLGTMILTKLGLRDPKNVPPAQAPGVAPPPPALTQTDVPQGAQAQAPQADALTPGIIDLTRQNIEQTAASAPSIYQPAPTTGAPYTPDEETAAQLAGIHKFKQRLGQARSLPGQVAEAGGYAESNPEAAAQMGLTPQAIGNFVESALNKGYEVGKNALDTFVSQFSRPHQFITHAAMADQWEDAAKRGLMGADYGLHNPDYKSWRDVLEKHNVEPGPTYDLPWGLGSFSGRDVAGLGLDFVADPMTYLTIGVGRGARFLEKAGRYLSPAGNETLIALEHAGMLSENPEIRSWLSFRGRDDLVQALDRVAPLAKEVIEDPSKVAALKPQLLKVMNPLGDEIEKAYREGKTFYPDATTGELRPVRHLEPVIQARMADKLGQWMLDHPKEASRLEDMGGLKLAGQTILPGRPIKEGISAALQKAAQASGDGMEWLGSKLEQVGGPLAPVGRAVTAAPHLAERLGRAVGESLSTSFGMPAEFARMLQRDFFHRYAGKEIDILHQVDDIFRGISATDDEAITRAIDSRQIGQLLTDRPDLVPIVTRLRVAQRALLDEQMKRPGLRKALEKAGLIDDDAYIFHYYKNRRRAMNLLEARNLIRPPRTYDPSTYQRIVPTLAEAEDIGLNPELRASKLLTMRLANGWRSIIAHDFLTEAVDRFKLRPVTALTDAEKAIADAAMTEGEGFIARPMVERLRVGSVDRTDPLRAKEIGETLALEGKTPLDLLGEMPDDVKNNFFRARFAKAFKSTAPAVELNRVRRKYKEFAEFWPKGETNNEVADVLGLPRLDPKDGGYRTVVVPGIGSTVLPGRIATKLQEMHQTSIFGEAGEPINELLRFYDRMLNPWRKYTTVVWPSFHVRNAYTNVINSALDIGLGVLNPQTRYEANALMRGQEIIIKSKTGQVVRGEQLMADFLRYGGMNTVYRRAQIGAAGAGVALAEDVSRDVSRWRRINPFFYFRHAGDAIENDARLTHFLALWKDGLSSDQAMERVFKFLFDYNNITPVERAFFRRLIPFWTWQRFNIPLQVEMSLRKPRVLLGLDKIWKALGSEKNPEKVYLEKDLMPAYLRNEYGINVGQGMGPQNVRYLVGLDLPQTDLNTLYKGNLGQTFSRAMDQMGGPGPALAQGIMGMITEDRDIQRGIDQGRPSYAAFELILKTPALKPLANFLEIKPGISRDGRRIIMANPSKAKVFAAAFLMDRPLREVSRFMGPGDSPTSALMRLFTGVHFVETNPQEERLRRIDDAYRRVNDYLTGVRGQLMPMAIEGGIPQTPQPTGIFQPQVEGEPVPATQPQ